MITMSLYNLLRARRKIDPTFHYLRDKESGEYYLRDEVIFRFDKPVSLADVQKSVDYYVSYANYILVSEGRSLINVHSISLPKDRFALVAGDNISILAIGGRTQPPPPPPPIILPPDFSFNNLKAVFISLDGRTQLGLVIATQIQIEQAR